MDRREKLKKFIEQDPQDYFSKHALAMEYLKVGNEGEARLLLESVLTECPSYIGSYYHLGRLYEKMGESAKALEVYEKGVEEAKKANERHAMGELMTAIDLME